MVPKSNFDSYRHLLFRRLQKTFGRYLLISDLGVCYVERGLGFGIKF
jgi:hypothetical protein